MKVKMNLGSLEVAIKEFNETTCGVKTSVLYHEKDGSFETICYTGNIILPDGVTAIFGKGESSPELKIGPKRKKYIVDFVERLQEGWAAWQVEYQLSERFL